MLRPTERQRQLVELYKAGVPWRELGHTPTVLRALARCGMRANRRAGKVADPAVATRSAAAVAARAARDRGIAAAYLSGLPVKLIARNPADTVGVYEALNRVGVTERRTKSWWPEAAELYRQSPVVGAVARKMGRSHFGTKYALSQMGLL